MIVLSDREKRIFIVVLFIAGGALLYTKAIEPLFRLSKRWGEDIAQDEVTLKRMIRDVGNKEEVESEFQELREKARLPVDEGEYETHFLSELDRLARRSGLEVNRQFPLIREEKGYVLEVPARLEAVATLEELVYFLGLLESSSQLIDARRVEINCERGVYERLRTRIQLVSPVVEEKEEEEEPGNRKL